MSPDGQWHRVKGKKNKQIVKVTMSGHRHSAQNFQNHLMETRPAPDSSYLPFKCGQSKLRGGVHTNYTPDFKDLA